MASASDRSSWRSMTEVKAEVTEVEQRLHGASDELQLVLHQRLALLQDKKIVPYAAAVRMSSAESAAVWCRISSIEEHCRSSG